MDVYIDTEDGVAYLSDGFSHSLKGDFDIMYSISLKCNPHKRVPTAEAVFNNFYTYHWMEKHEVNFDPNCKQILMSYLTQVITEWAENYPKGETK